MTYKIKYPRKRLLRRSFQKIARFLIKLLTRTTISGLENFPEQGPLIVVGNHTGVMEVVLMAAFAPRIIEFMGSVDIPHEKISAIVIDAYGCIPVQRGNVSREAMQAGLDVLAQGGVIGVFPEGGIWEPSIRKAQTGVSWLSYHGQASVLPIGFSSMQGALGRVFSFKFPELVMNVGSPIEPTQIKPGLSRKEQLQNAAQEIMDAVYDLIPEAERLPEEQIIDERFECLITVKNSLGVEQNIPKQFKVRHGYYFTKFVHRSTLFNTLRDNLKLPIQALKDLARHPSNLELSRACKAIIDYIEDDNPYYFTYRYGQKDGSRIEEGIREIQRLAEWAQSKGFSLEIIPRRRYYTLGQNEEVIDDTPKEIKKL
jgi:1-acyl-sn-glycerol-3-phosphate acyltransferase